MDIVIAKEAGACYGVNRSLDIVKDAAKDYKNTATYGSLIHNPIVVEQLRNDYAVDKIESLDTVSSHNVETLVIRSHGVVLDVLNKAEEMGLNIIDATCPHVKKVQDTAAKLAEELGHVIVIGKTGHPEVEGVCSYVAAKDAKFYVLQKKDELENTLPHLKKIEGKIGVVSQTTQSVDVFNVLIEAMEKQGLDLKVKNTICGATKHRQEAAEELSKKVDAIIVLGGHNSSNTTHLAELCSKHCKKTFHVENFDEFSINDINGCEHIGLTAGASTPQSQIEDFINTLEQHIS